MAFRKLPFALSLFADYHYPSKVRTGIRVSVRIGISFSNGWLEFNVPFQHKYGYIRNELVLVIRWASRQGVSGVIGYQSTRHTVMSSHGQLVTYVSHHSQLVT